MDEKKAYEVVKRGIKMGYRIIDCAYEYCNEKGVGKAIKECIEEGIVSRSSLFIVSKLWNTFHSSRDVEKGIRESLNRLSLSYLDLFLIHWPIAFKHGKELYPRENGHILYSHTPLSETWKAMKILAEEKKLARHVGLSNCPSLVIHDLVMETDYVPFANQIESHLYLQQPALIDWCQKKGIIIMAYSPLGGSYDYGISANSSDFVPPLENQKVKKLAKEKNCSPGEILLAWHFKRTKGNYIVVTKSEKEERLKSALEIFQGKKKIEFSDEEMKELEKEDRKLRLNDAAKVFWEIPSFE